MSGRPSTPIPTFAENGTYPAGSDPWSGTVTKVVPSYATRNAGHVPNTQQPAQYENSIKNSYGVWFDFLADIGVLNWSPRLSKDQTAASLTLSYNGSSRAQNFWSDYHQAWIVMGQNTVGKFFVGDANSLEPFTFGGVKFQFGVAANNGNLILCEGPSNVYNRVAGPLSGGSPQTFPGTSGTPFTDSAIRLASGTLLVAGSKQGTDTTVWRSTDSGVNWTAINANVGIVFSPMMFAERAGQILLVELGNASVEHGMVSTDDGQTWANMPASGSSSFVDIQSIWYSVEEDQYVAMCSADRLAIINPALGFTFRTFASVGLSFAAGEPQAIAVAGSMILLATDNGANKRAYYMSWDLGLHWRKFGRNTYSGAPRLASNPLGQFFTSSVLDVQQSLACAGVGATARGE